MFIFVSSRGQIKTNNDMLMLKTKLTFDSEWTSILFHLNKGRNIEKNHRRSN